MRHCERAHGDKPLCLEPAELFGFGLGSFETVAESPDVPSIPFNIDSDLDNVVVISASSNLKKLVRTCSAIASSLNDGIPDVGIQLHKLTQKTRMREGKHEEPSFNFMIAISCAQFETNFNMY